MGCMSFFIIGLIAFFILLGCAWFGYSKAVSMFTADAPVAIAVATPTSDEVAAANAKLDEFHAAVRRNQAATIAFTSTDLNALIATNPDFAANKGRLRVTLADSQATLEMSVSLASVHLPRLKHRWFNGSARARFSYEDGDFDFDPLWIEANGHELSSGALRSFGSSFSNGFSRSFEESMDKNGGSAFWKSVKSMSIDGDRLIIQTRGEQAASI